jgi:hypothetical protein
MQLNVLSRVSTALLLGAVLASPAMAADDSKYPAYDFTPNVIYRDPALTTQSTSPAAETHAPDPRYPAAHFTPSVIHPAKPADAETHAPDPKYPAAYFTPSVIHPAN